MKMNFFFHFFFFVYHAHVDMTVVSLGSSHSSAQRFERFPKKILNNKYMKLNKIHVTVHVMWTTSFSPSNDIAKRNWAPSFIAAGVHGLRA